MFDNMYNRNGAYNPYGSYNQPASYALGMYNRPAAGNQITWVMGMENAKTFPIAPNSTILLMDSEAPKFYIKTSDVNGMCSLDTYTFTKCAPQQESKTETPDLSQFVTRDELNAALEKMVAAPTTTTPAASRQSLI